MRRRLTYKTAIFGGSVGILILFTYSAIFFNGIGQSDTFIRSKKNERRIASIEGQELDAILKSAADKKKTEELKPHFDLPPKSAPVNKINIQTIYQKRMQNARKLMKNGKYRGGGYASRTLIEDLKLPEEWSLSPTLEKTLADRKEHVKEVCRTYGLDQRTEARQPNAWEYLVNEEYNLLWCPVFKAASSTWMFNFNLLSGYTENFLYGAKDTPVALARKKYPRLNTEELDAIVNRSSKPLTFMITRHPFERLVSAFRDKILSGSRYYRKLFMDITSRYPKLANRPTGSDIEKLKDPLERARMRRLNARVKIPSFRQFVQYLIDSNSVGQTMNEHWAPMNDFCTPCLINIDVFAKIETLDEDGNYIIFKSGIEQVIKPKRINRSKKGPTNNVVTKYLCQLSPTQKTGLVDVYKFDLLLFNYDYNHLFNCSQSIA